MRLLPHTIDTASNSTADLDDAHNSQDERGIRCRPSADDDMQRPVSDSELDLLEDDRPYHGAGSERHLPCSHLGMRSVLAIPPIGAAESSARLVVQGPEGIAKRRAERALDHDLARLQDRAPEGWRFLRHAHRR
jgi:hypothetical protein